MTTALRFSRLPSTDQKLEGEMEVSQKTGKNMKRKVYRWETMPCGGLCLWSRSRCFYSQRIRQGKARSEWNQLRSYFILHGLRCHWGVSLRNTSRPKFQKAHQQFLEYRFEGCLADCCYNSSEKWLPLSWLFFHLKGRATERHTYLPSAPQMYTASRPVSGQSQLPFTSCRSLPGVAEIHIFVPLSVASNVYITRKPWRWDSILATWDTDAPNRQFNSLHHCTCPWKHVMLE